MDRMKLFDYRRRLTDERVRVIRSINRNRNAADDMRVEHTEDEGDLAIISHDRALLYDLNQTDLAWLKAIREAVDRIDRDEYGECLNCQEDIDERRLTAVPWVGLCLQCQEQIETDRVSERYLAANAEPEPPEF
jgi:DnaK suppressor protein